MKKGVIVFVSALMLAGCGSYSQKASSYKTSTTTTRTTAQTTNTTAAEETPVEIYVGDTWIVEGQWAITFDGVAKTDERNQYTDKDKGEPAEVYSLTYHYENLGYVDKIGEGLYFRLDRETVIDSTGLLGDSYPLSGKSSAQYAPAGTKCEVESFIALKNPGNFKIDVSMYDGNGDKQTALFVYDGEGESNAKENIHKESGRTIPSKDLSRKRQV